MEMDVSELLTERCIPQGQSLLSGVFLRGQRSQQGSQCGRCSIVTDVFRQCYSNTVRGEAVLLRLMDEIAGFTGCATRVCVCVCSYSRSLVCVCVFDPRLINR